MSKFIFWMSGVFIGFGLYSIVDKLDKKCEHAYCSRADLDGDGIRELYLNKTDVNKAYLISEDSSGNVINFSEFKGLEKKVVPIGDVK